MTRVRGFIAPELSQVENLTQNCKLSEMFWTWPVSEGNLERNSVILFLNWLSNLSNLILSHGTKTVQNLIQLVLE